MKLVWKILKEHLSKSQLLGFLLANIIGFTIIMFGLQLYLDISPLLSSNTDFLKPEYLVISKSVSTIDTFRGTKPTFSPEEQEDIKSQPFVEDMGAFCAAQYAVDGSIHVRDINVSTEMFFEAVPDKFVDTQSDQWEFTEDDEFIPIIIPRDYLSLFNFGFAQGYDEIPVISDQLLSSIVLNIDLYGEREEISMKGQVVGLSNRLNTILVPQAFIDWSNKRLATSPQDWQPSRLILQINNPTDKRITEYMNDNGYVVANDKLDASKTMWFLRLIIGIVIAIGIIICVLACYVLVLSIFLLLQKNEQQLRNLLMLGYGYHSVLSPYCIVILSTNICAFSLACINVLLMRDKYLSILQELSPGYSSSVTFFPIGILLVLTIFIILLNICILYRRIHKLI